MQSTRVALQMLCRVDRECLQESAAELGRMKAEFLFCSDFDPPAPPLPSLPSPPPPSPPFPVPAEFQVLHRCVNMVAADGAASDDNDDDADAPVVESNGVGGHERAKTREV